MLPKRTTSVFAIVGLVLVGGILATVAITRHSPAADAIRFCETNVRGRLNSPAAGNFHDHPRPAVTVAANRYRVTGTVDDRDADAHTIPVPFSCELILESDGGFTLDLISVGDTD